MEFLADLELGTPRTWWERLRQPGLVQNALTLYGVHGINYLLPLILIPYLTHVLGVDRWAQVALAQALGAYVLQTVEYGFNLSGTRAVSQHRDAPDRLAELLAGILAAKGLLAAASVTLAAVAGALIPGLRNDPAYLAGGLLWGVAIGFQLSWYYQGLERMRLVAMLTVLGRALGVAAIVLLVRRPDDGWKVLFLQGMALVASTAVALGLAYREIPFRWPSLRRGWTALLMGWNLFLNQGALTLYAIASTIILGLFAPLRAVAYFASAEKLTTALVGLLMSPISWAVYPRLVHLAHGGRSGAVRLARLFLLVSTGGGLALGIVLFLAAPFLVGVLFPHDFAPAVPVLRILALIAPLTAGAWSMAIWMLTQGMDRTVTAVTVTTGVVNVLLALVLAHAYAHLGAAAALVLAEVLGAAVAYTILRRRRLDPLTMSMS
jgi:PST family polysaccharide transporter